MTGPTADAPGKDQTWTTEGGCEVDKNHGAPGWEPALDTTRWLFAPWSIPAYKKERNYGAQDNADTKEKPGLSPSSADLTSRGCVTLPTTPTMNEKQRTESKPHAPTQHDENWKKDLAGPHPDLAQHEE
jgi:hypothetical protein